MKNKACVIWLLGFPLSGALIGCLRRMVDHWTNTPIVVYSSGGEFVAALLTVLVWFAVANSLYESNKS